MSVHGLMHCQTESACKLEEQHLIFRLDPLQPDAIVIILPGFCSTPPPPPPVSIALSGSRHGFTSESTRQPRGVKWRNRAGRVDSKRALIHGGSRHQSLAALTTTRHPGDMCPRPWVQSTVLRSQQRTEAEEQRRREMSALDGKVCGCWGRERCADALKLPLQLVTLTSPDDSALYTMDTTAVGNETSVFLHTSPMHLVRENGSTIPLLADHLRLDNVLPRRQCPRPRDRSQSGRPDL
ncbi:uncharacterized protein [Narcine bancroftii]|uniref:uncharacterized protein n=1 Tax=Narcine bancroftii TaxID=1343680 RepID=UPI003831C614